jgi:hypothetical protein
MTTVDEYARHSAYSDPGAYAHLLAAVPADLPTLTDTVRNVLIHYRSGVEIPPEHLAEIDNRWIDRILATDQSRHPHPLDVHRDDTQKVAGCCRDYSLLTVATLRQHGIAARCRVGFATYFFEGFNVDHVLAEVWDGGRWRFVDSQLAPGPMWPMDTQDVPIAVGEEAVEKPYFYTAAQAWTAYRRGAVDPTTFGVHPDMPHLCGAGFMAGEVFIELTHRMRDELLLWDLHGGVGAGPGVADEALVDEIAGLMLRADGGDRAAEEELARRYAADDRLHPGDTVRCLSPQGADNDVNLRTRVAVPHLSSPDGQAG